DFRRLVDLAKFTPLGNRGFIKGRGAGFGCADWADTKSLEEYFENSNDRLIVMPQCETREALENIEEIAAIPGSTASSSGPSTFPQPWA
ncbi:MAG: hypothetical protein IIZ55_04395, partial [Firmicutes bacterium]|nr:hypothetical protein [Bacillota bacterium]